MRAPGKLRAWITFERNTPTRDTAGGEVPHWAPDFRTDAQFQPLGSREFPSFQKRHSQATARFRIRYRSGIDPALHRISYNGKYWDITDPVPDDRRRELLIEVSEIK